MPRVDIAVLGLGAMGSAVAAALSRRNVGVIAFDREHEISFKVETHNHPSALEPFGGANTGVGGVVPAKTGVVRA